MEFHFPGEESDTPVIDTPVMDTSVMWQSCLLICVVILIVFIVLYFYREKLKYLYQYNCTGETFDLTTNQITYDVKEECIKLALEQLPPGP